MTPLSKNNAVFEQQQNVCHEKVASGQTENVLRLAEKQLANFQGLKFISVCCQLLGRSKLSYYVHIFFN